MSPRGVKVLTLRFIRIKFADWKEAILSELLVKGTVL